MTSFGRYRRAVRLVTTPSLLRAEMEDDVHHFRIAIQHDGATVIQVTGEAIRTPYVICPQALKELSRLAGCALTKVIAMPAAERFQHCMHLHDLAAWAASRAHQTAFKRLFQIEVDHDLSPLSARLWCDGAPVLQWMIDQGRLVGGAYDGILLSALPQHLPLNDFETVESAMLLRRAALISFVRRIDLDAFANASAVNPASPANCFAKQAGSFDDARRNVGMTRDFFELRRWPLETAAPSSTEI